MGIFQAIDISASGLTAERLRMDIISNNLANINTTRTAEGGPYRRQVPIFQARGAKSRIITSSTPLSERVGNGVRVLQIIRENKPPRLVYDPNHPDADENGYVRFPQISVVKEMVDLISASRAYEANIAVINSAKKMITSALSIGPK